MEEITGPITLNGDAFPDIKINDPADNVGYINLEKPEVNKGGRPTKYKEEFCDKVIDYLEGCQDEIDNYVKSSGDKGETYQRVVKVSLPTIEGFSSFLDVSVDSLERWGDKYPKFCGALNEIRREQKKRLLDKGLSGDYNPMIAKLILSSNHGMNEKKETEQTILKVKTGDDITKEKADEIKRSIFNSTPQPRKKK